MKTSRLLLAGTVGMLVSYHSVAGPLDNWHWRNPLANGNPQFGAQILNGMVYATGKFVAVGDSGVVCISSDGTNWSQSMTVTSNNVNGLVYGGGQFVAVGSGGVVETSPDGTNWVVRNSSTANYLSQIAYANGKYVAVGLDPYNGTGAVISSTDGINWTLATSGLTTAMAVAGGTNGFIATTANSDELYYSVDGLVWSTQIFSVPNSGYPYPTVNQAVTFWNGLYLVSAYHYDTTGSAEALIFSSPDASNWTTNDLGVEDANTGAFNYSFFMTGNNSVIAAGEASNQPFLQFSTDGVHWYQTNATYNNGGLAMAPPSGAYGNGTYALIGWNSSTIYTSTDAVNWTNRQYVPPAVTGPNYTFTCIASNNGVDVAVSSSLVAISSNGLSYVVASNTPALASVMTLSNGFVGVGSGGAIYVSTDGLNWTQRTSGTANNLHGIAFGNSLLVAVGDDGAIQTSPSGLIWTSRTSGTSLALYGIIFTNGIFVATGQEGTVLTSPDGVNWSGQYSGVLSNLLSITYGSAGFLAVGPGGTIVSSPDGTNWVTQNSGTTVSLQSVTFGSGYYFATGINGTVFTSPDGVSWTGHNVGLTGGQNLYGCAFIGGRFLVVGSNGTILESDVIPPLFNVQFTRGAGQTVFEMFAPSGMTGFRLQGSSSPLGIWSDLASFNNAAAVSWWTNTSSTGSQQFYRLISP